MSMYHNQQGYGHNAYGYIQQAPMQLSSAHFPYHSPHFAPPSFIMDANSFRRDYAARLSELTINSRPIIQNLSVIAQEYIRFADIVSQCLEAHIRRVVPWMKLPAFYLLDAISKNVFDPYAAKFSSFVVSLFLEAYHHVDHATKSKMEEMLVTWRSGAPNGKELFGVAVQVAIERSIWGGDGVLNENSSSSRRLQGSVPITKSQVLAELEVTLAQKERQFLNNPYDSNSQSHVGVLQQLRKMVEAGVSQEELSQILVQLRTLSHEAATVLHPPPVPTSLFHSSSTTAVRSSHPTSVLQSYIQQPLQPSQSASTPYKAQNQAAPPDIPINNFASSATSNNNISNLLNTLLKAGLVSSNAGIARTETVSSADEIKSESLAIASREYAKAILVKKIKLTTSELTKYNPSMLAFLHERLPVQCKQCAIRFPDNSIGKKKMEDHLDMHFRQNRKVSENVGRGHSRSWYMSLESWINDNKGDIKGKSRMDSSKLGGVAAANAEAAKEAAALRCSYVVIPPGDEVKNILCPICKETVKSEFMEENEEWVWRNAVRIRDKIYHATCRAEMVASAAFTAKLRDEMRSRSGTPEADLTKSTPPGKQQRSKLRESKSPTAEQISMSNKRKVDDVLPDMTDEAAPPAKRIAVLENTS